MADKMSTSKCVQNSSSTSFSSFFSDTSIPCMKRKYTYNKIMKGKRYVHKFSYKIFSYYHVDRFLRFLIIDYQMGKTSSRYEGLLEENN